MNQKQQTTSTIALNRKARHEYSIEDRYEAGMVLEGWEVKSIRAGRIQLNQGHVILKNNAAWLIGAQITPLQSASTHIHPDPQRTRKLLLHQQEFNKLIGLVERRGFTILPLAMYWKKNKVKLEIGLAKGKKLHDKRADEKKRDWDKNKQQLLKKYRKDN